MHSCEINGAIWYDSVFDVIMSPKNIGIYFILTIFSYYVIRGPVTISWDLLSACLKRIELHYHNLLLVMHKQWWNMIKSEIFMGKSSIFPVLEHLKQVLFKWWNFIFLSTFSWSLLQLYDPVSKMQTIGPGQRTGTNMSFMYINWIIQIYTCRCLPCCSSTT